IVCGCSCVFSSKAWNGGNDKHGSGRLGEKLYRGVEAVCATRSPAAGFVPISPATRPSPSRSPAPGLRSTQPGLLGATQVASDLLAVVIELLEPQHVT